MSVETRVMKNLIDMGIVDTRKESMASQYKTPDGNYIFNLRRKPRLSFLSADSMSSYICEIEITTTMNTPILTMYANEVNISQLIDNFYSVVEYNVGSSIYHYINPSNTNCIPRMIGLFLKDFMNPPYLSGYLTYNDIYNPDYVLEIYDMVDEQMVKRVSVQMKRKDIEELLEKIYYTFLIDVPDSVIHPDNQIVNYYDI